MLFFFNKFSKQNDESFAVQVTQEKLKTQFLLDSYSLCPTKQDIFITNSILENLFLQLNFTNMEKLATISHAKRKKYTLH